MTLCYSITVLAIRERERDGKDDSFIDSKKKNYKLENDAVVVIVI